MEGNLLFCALYQGQPLICEFLRILPSCSKKYIVLIQIIFSEVDSGESKGQGRDRKGERKWRKRRRPTQRRENLLNHIAYFNFHCTHSLRKQEMENLTLRSPFCPSGSCSMSISPCRVSDCYFSSLWSLQHDSNSWSVVQPKTQWSLPDRGKMDCVAHTEKLSTSSRHG